MEQRLVWQPLSVRWKTMPGELVAAAEPWRSGLSHPRVPKTPRDEKAGEPRQRAWRCAHCPRNFRYTPGEPTRVSVTSLE